MGILVSISLYSIEDAQLQVELLGCKGYVPTYTLISKSKGPPLRFHQHWYCQTSDWVCT